MISEIRQSYIAKVLITWVLIVGGMTLAGFCPNHSLYSLFLIISLLPALLFIGWCMHETWMEFWQLVLLLSIIATTQAILTYLNSDLSHSVLIPLAVMMLLEPLKKRIRSKKNTEQTPGTDK